MGTEPVVYFIQPLGCPKNQSKTVSDDITKRDFRFYRTGNAI